jgi:hypothetical protein
MKIKELNKYFYFKVLFAVPILSIIFLLTIADAAEFYVDPDFTGVSNGSHSAPWNKLDASAIFAWNSINTALTTDDVTIYFSARSANSDKDQTTSKRISIMRTDTSTHHLTLDGMSKYNSNDSKPVWYGYKGASRYSITTSGYCIESSSLGWVKQNYVTIRGFKGKTTGHANVFYYWGGDHILVDKNDFSMTSTSSGCCAFFEYAHLVDRGSVYQNGGCTDITFRNNIIHDTAGEGIYIGGSQNTGLPSHSYITIENNTIYNTGIYATNGDCIDLKDGLSNVIVRGNICHNATGNNPSGIISHSPATVENNVIFNSSYSGISFNTYWGRGYSGVTINNNMIYNCGFSGVEIWSGDISKPISDIIIDHNTILGNKHDGITASVVIGGNITNFTIKNNIIFNNTNYGINAWGFTPNCSHNDIYGNQIRLRNCNETGDISVDPAFVNSDNPMGSDGQFWTKDDGLKLKATSSVGSASETGGPIGILPINNDLLSPTNLRIIE